MGCDSWKEKLDAYIDGEVSENELRAFDAHVRGCASCSADALARVQMKRSIQAAGKAFYSQRRISPKNSKQRHNKTTA